MQALVDSLDQLITNTSIFALAAGALLGIAVVLLVRGGQVWRFRQIYGYSVYEADATRKRLLRWSALGATTALIFGIVHLISTNQDQSPVQLGVDVIEVATIPETRLLIPSLAIEAHMIEAPYVARQWDISRLREEVAHLQGTSYPGEAGNVVLAGHITIPGAGWGPFRELDTLAVGDFVFMEVQDETFVYEVTELMIVDPSAVEVTYPTEDSRLTLITCSNWDEELETYAQRIVVVARLVSTRQAENADS